MPAAAPILLADDEEHDIYFMKRAFDLAKVANPLHTVRDGAEAIEYLSATGAYNDRQKYPLPCVLITDLKMPRVDGFELLAWLQSRPQFKNLPRLVISSSCHEADFKRSLELGAHAYFTKPFDSRSLVELVKQWQQHYFVPHCG